MRSGVRRGRKKLADEDACLLSDLYALVEPASHGDPLSPLRWSWKSNHRLPVELKAKDHEFSLQTICDFPGQIHFSRQSTRKTREGCKHKDPDAQFPRIAKTVTRY